MGTRNLSQLYDECKAELKSIGIEPNPIKEVKVNPRPKRRLGRARCRNGEYTIEISGITLRKEVPDEKVKQVIIHEMLHCCDGANNHGDTWKRLLRKWDWLKKRYTPANTKSPAKSAEASTTANGHPMWRSILSGTFVPNVAVHLLLRI